MNLRGVWQKVEPLNDPASDAPTCSMCIVTETEFRVPMVPHVSYPKLFQCPSCGRLLIATESLT